MLNQTFNQDNLGNLSVAASVSLAAPTYTTGTIAALSLTTAGLLRVDGSGVTQPISASSLPLPTGAATAALQSTINSSLLALSGQLPSTLGQKASTASLAVVLASDQSAVPVTGTFFQATQPVSVTSLPLPTDASTSALQTTGNTSLAAIASQLPSTLGQKASTASLAVVLASDQSAITVTPTASSSAALTSVAGSATSVSLLVSNAARKGMIIFNDSTAILYLAFAATASSTAFSEKLQPGSGYNSDINYTGVVSGIWSSAVGSARITEFT